MSDGLWRASAEEEICRRDGEMVRERGEGWIGNVEVAKSHIQACVTGPGKFPADLVLLKIAGWG